MISLVTGGARSGKSVIAERITLAYGKDAHYIATAQAFDAEMVARIAEHKKIIILRLFVGAIIVLIGLGLLAMLGYGIYAIADGQNGLGTGLTVGFFVLGGVFAILVKLVLF